MRLNAEAQIFEPHLAVALPKISPSLAMPLHADIKSVIRPVVQALQARSTVRKVTVTEGLMGSLTTLAVELREEAATSVRAGAGQPQAWQQAVSLAKDILIHAAERSTSTYVLGYTLEPFSDVDDGGFGATLSMVPFSMEGMACWDMYQKGFCARHGQCECYHPDAGDLAQVRVILAKRPEPASRAAAADKR